MALVKATCEGLGMVALMGDWGQRVELTIYADASAALGIVGRRGAGKLRHVNIGMLWVQAKSADGTVQFKKVLGTENPSDLMTKHNGWPTITKLLEIMAQEFRSGRAKLSSELSKGINSFLMLARFIGKID